MTSKGFEDQSLSKIIQNALNSYSSYVKFDSVQAKSLQLCQTLCHTVDCSWPGSSVQGILQVRKLEWVTISSSRGSSDAGIKPQSLMSPAFSGGLFTTSTTWEAQNLIKISLNAKIIFKIYTRFYQQWVVKMYQSGSNQEADTSSQLKQESLT